MIIWYYKDWRIFDNIASTHNTIVSLDDVCEFIKLSGVYCKSVKDIDDHYGIEMPDEDAIILKLKFG